MTEHKQKKHFYIPECCAEGKWVYVYFFGHEYTLHPDSARRMAQMLIEAADNTEDEGGDAIGEQKRDDPCGYEDLDREKHHFSERWEAMRKALNMPKRGKDNGSRSSDKAIR